MWFKVSCFGNLKQISVIYWWGEYNESVDTLKDWLADEATPKRGKILIYDKKKIFL